MPYIEKKDRQAIDAGHIPSNPGQLTYALIRSAEHYLFEHGESYTTFNAILGAYEACKQELYRTTIGPYESAKAMENGSLSHQVDLAWAAGFFDGEGSTLARTVSYDHIGTDGKTYPQIHTSLGLQVPQKSPLLLLRFKEAIGGFGYIHKREKDREIWLWRLSAKTDCLFVIKLLWPYLGLYKREQAQHALEAKGLGHLMKREERPA